MRTRFFWINKNRSETQDARARICPPRNLRPKIVQKTELEFVWNRRLPSHRVGRGSSKNPNCGACQFRSKIPTPELQMGSISTPGAKLLETLPGCIQFGKPAAFLFDQVVFRSARALRGRENVSPVRGALTEQNRISLRGVWGPILAMQRTNSPRICTNPGDWVRSGLQASAHIQLQHDRRFRVL